MEQAEPEFEDIEGDVIARTHEIARWRETGDVAYERDFAVRLTLDDERIVRIVVMSRGAASVGRRSRDTTLTRSCRVRQARFALAWSAIQRRAASRICFSVVRLSSTPLLTRKQHATRIASPPSRSAPTLPLG
jgi:hypothetical protein